MNAVELKPCPFCGAKPTFSKVADFESADYGGNFISCPTCGACSIMRFSTGEDCRPLLAEAWNRRAKQEPVVDYRALSVKVSEAVGLLDRIVRNAPVGYADSHPNYFKVGAQAYRKRTLKDAKQDAKLAAKILRDVWDELDPTITSIEAKEAAQAPSPVVADDFLAGICVALQCVTAFDSGVLWSEIIKAVGKDAILNYARNIEPDEWILAGFAKYAEVELEVDTNPTGKAQ